jgi:hypothetical protein
MSDDKKKVKLFAYAVAWVAYLGAFLTRAANIGNVVRDSFADIHAPQKDEYYN